METARKSKVSGTIDMGHVARVIRDTLSERKFVATTNIYKRGIIVDVFDPKIDPGLTYIVQKEGVLGPDPSNHNGTSTVIDALVQNVQEELLVRGLVYNKDNRRYEGKFSTF